MNITADRFHKLIALLEEHRLSMERCKALSVKIEEELKEVALETERVSGN